ncbi:hypothetical protein CTA2_8759 [Colletotrichum tanaceti]|nr:hypothetical protein CTA2_8759 [Colletotrichum tanaceti]
MVMEDRLLRHKSRIPAPKTISITLSVVPSGIFASPPSLPLLPRTNTSDPFPPFKQLSISTTFCRHLHLDSSKIPQTDLCDFTRVHDEASFSAPDRLQLLLNPPQKNHRPTSKSTTDKNVLQIAPCRLPQGPCDLCSPFHPPCPPACARRLCRRDEGLPREGS